MQTFSVTDNKTETRFEIKDGTKIAFLEYRIHEAVISFLHTEVPEEIGGKGLANALADHAFKFAAAHAMKVKNYCAFISVYVKRHPELQHFIQK